MPTIGSITKTVRINPNDLEVIEGIMKSEGVTWSGAVHTLAENYQKSENSEGTPTKEDGCKPLGKPEDIENIRQMGGFFGFDVEGMIHLLSEGLEGGYITVKEGKLAGEIDLNLEDFYDVCHDKGIEPQKAIDKMVSMLWK